MHSPTPIGANWKKQSSPPASFAIKLEASWAVAKRSWQSTPDKMEALTPLPGVGRKTANVLLGNAFGQPGITVDTHLGRLSRRMGLTTHTDPEKVESDL